MLIARSSPQRRARASLSGARSRATIFAGNRASGDHPQSDRAATGHHPDVVEGRIRPFHRVQSTGQRLDEGCLGRRQVGADLVHQRTRREDHVAGHRARRTALEAVDVVRGAHVVLPADAVATLPAGHDLLAGDAVTLRHTPALGRCVVESDDTSDELVPRDHRRLDVRRPVLVTPELGGAVIALQVAGADADGFHPDQRFAWSRHGHRDLLQPVVFGAVADDRLHGVGDFGSRCGHGAGLPGGVNVNTAVDSAP